MANNHHPSDGGPTDDFFEQILGFPAYASTDANLAGNSTGAPMMLQLSSGDGRGGFHGGSVFPLGLSLDQGNKQGFHEDVVGDGRSSSSSMKNTFSGQPMPNTVSGMPHPPSIRPRVRARRGQATDPHSIAERLRRERIAERIRALQDLVPSVNKTDRAAMLDEIVEYVKFLRLQVKVLSMSRLGGAGAVAPLVTDIPISSLEMPVKLEGIKQLGRSGQTMGQKSRWLSLWKKMSGLPCSSSSRRHFASCPSHWPQQYTTHSHRMPPQSSSPNHIPRHEPN